MKLNGKGALTTQADFLQQRPSRPMFKVERW
ncbi:hypothetical protein PhaeoP75_04167 (plasmid) [Phaeobacter gallaeciensis]|jgi:hypothetical protein|uniref:Uncharacterized protein n=1 Tax=Phaeobacter gallaeciensis TaxID=60890 RepID=A0AAC9ZDJ0_9RHOB|nr:hypothetical protein Gal_04092 [Phaeobacter gallaeciensis DSM 26640]ATE95064.1 hypothetical protein PhaeoP11_04078 [Phaeobacter gallaeciensis]ATF03768.1 hypothetical protein PhaeoP75_04167 [Phaeobacter gallaeciensis]ATF08536.1 hypothetical protein PhaeoP63_04507 [Phaeobacter gallaeciensis]